MVVQLYEYTTNHRILHFKRKILWYINYISVKLLKKKEEYEL